MPHHKFKLTAQSESIKRRPKAPLVTSWAAGSFDAHLRRRRCSTVNVTWTQRGLQGRHSISEWARSIRSRRQPRRVSGRCCASFSILWPAYASSGARSGPNSNRGVSGCGRWSVRRRGVLQPPNTRSDHSLWPLPRRHSARNIPLPPSRRSPPSRRTKDRRVGTQQQGFQRV